MESMQPGKPSDWEMEGRKHERPESLLAPAQFCAAEQDVKAFAEEIALFKANVEEVTGNEVTAEKLAEAIKVINNRIRDLEELHKPR